MIHLHTNYLIEVARLQSPQGEEAKRWLLAGEQIGTSAIAWSEFLTGPFTTDQLRRVEAILDGNITDFGTAEADCAAKLYNLAGRKLEKRIDSFIAAAAICARVSLATRNRKDFLPFVASGLRLA